MAPRRAQIIPPVEMHSLEEPIRRSTRRKVPIVLVASGTETDEEQEVASGKVEKPVVVRKRKRITPAQPKAATEKSIIPKSKPETPVLPSASKGMGVRLSPANCEFGDEIEPIDGLEYLEISINDPHEMNLEDSYEEEGLGTNGSRRRRHQQQQRRGEVLEADSILAAQKRHERLVRIAARHVHIICLLFSFSSKSRTLNNPLRKAIMLSMVPAHLMRQFSPEILADGRTLLNALSMLANWWKNSNSNSQKGEEELASEFVIILRALGLKTRLVCSLQPIPIKKEECDGDKRDSMGILAGSSTPNSSPTKTFKEESTGKSQGGRHPRTKLKSKTGSFVSVLSITDQSKSSTSIISRNQLPPVIWAEVRHPVEQRWVPVDGVRAIINDRLLMEQPSQGKRQHLIIIAYDSIGRAIDVTRRYSSRYYAITAKRRRLDEPILSRVLNLIGFSEKDNSAEEAELAGLVDGEPIPKTLAGFQGHGRYMLERQLKKYEVFWPPNVGIVGEFRGENVRLRSVLQKVRSKEAWYTQFGRVIRDDELPCKEVPLPAKPVSSKGLGKSNQSVLDSEILLITSSVPGEKRLQPLYGEWQTIPFSPPVAADGKVPRNKFGNVDLYLPSMLPIGCVWIDDESAYLAARDLEIDYAAACVRFAFSGRIAVPNLRGIVVCAEFEGAIRRRLAEIKLELIAEAVNRVEEERQRKIKLEGRKKRIREKIEQTHHHILEKDDTNDEPVRIVSALDPLNHQKNADNNDFDNLF